MALADYDKAIAHAKQFQDKPPVVSAVPRTIGAGKQSQRAGSVV